METRAQIYKSVPIPGTSDFLAYLETGEITYASIQGAISAKVLGKPYDCGSAWTAGSVFEKLLRHSKKWKAYAPFVSVKDGDTHQEALIDYKGSLLFSLKVKKKKGKYHSSIFRGGYWDWTVCDVAIEEYEGRPLADLAAAFSFIDAKVVDREKKAEEEQERLYSLFKGILALYPEGHPLYKIEADLRKIASDGYRFKSLLEKETEK